MDYQQFKNFILSAIQERYLDYQIEIQVVHKNNGIELDGLVIKREDVCISPTIYIQGYFERYADGEDIEEVINDVCNVYEMHKNDMIPLDLISKISDFASIQNMIYPVVINKKRNSRLLSECPHRQLFDLAVVYRIHIDFMDDTVASVLVKNQLSTNIWKVDEESLFNIAISNMNRLFPPIVQNMSEILIEIMHERGVNDEEIIDDLASIDIEKRLMVCTNQQKSNGAGVIFLNEDLQKKVAEQMGGSFVIIPSSIHETIITDMVDINKIKDMVHEVNATEVSEQELLSDNVYIYDENGIHLVI